MDNPYYPHPAVIEEMIEETPTIKTLVLRPEAPISFQAGQFMQLTLPGMGEAPFTPSSSPRVAERMEITILRTGRVTDALHGLSAGDTVGLRGPFGRGYPLEKMQGKEILVVGGGVGLAPLRSLLLSLFENIALYKRVSIQYGARTPDELLYRDSFAAWAKLDKVDFTATVDRGDAGWTGRVGLVTELLKDVDIHIADSYAVSCGPSVMLKFVTYALLEKGYAPEQIYLSMNRRMSCGTGKCGRCTIGPYYLCKDGPDMNYAKIRDFPNVFA
ncbi:MAG: FAD/NAD(P)-binding protein [Planctomycetota bacterium]